MNHATDPTSDRASRTYTAEETLYFQNLCRQRRKNADRWQQILNALFLAGMALNIGGTLVTAVAPPLGAPVASPAIDTWSHFSVVIALIAVIGWTQCKQVRCPACTAKVPAVPSRDPSNDTCEHCGLQLTPVVDEPIAAPRNPSNEAVGRFQPHIRTQRRQASVAQFAGIAFFIVCVALLITPFARDQITTRAVDAMDIVLILGAMICFGLGLRFVTTAWRVRCPVCNEQLLGNPTAMRRFCHFCAQPIRETAKGEGYWRKFHYECPCRPGASQGGASDRLSDICHCPHCGVKLISSAAA